MKTDSPGAVMDALGRIDDDLAELAIEHAKLTGYCRSMKDYLKTLNAVLFEQAEGSSAKEREFVAQALMHEHEDYKSYLVHTKRLGELDVQFNYLDTRRSIGQSVLKQMQRDADEKMGRGQG
jgi:hypothetical protein